MSDFFLPYEGTRKYELKIEDGIFRIEGNYWLYDVSDIYERKNSIDTVSADEYLGMGKLKMRPLRYVATFIAFPTIIRFLIKMLRWIFRASTESDFMSRLYDFGSSLLNLILIAFVLYGLFLIFSIKDLVEISFISKHICIPRKSLTDLQYKTLNSTLLEYKR